MSNFTKKKQLSEENLEEIVNSREDSDMSSENISRPISFRSEEDDSCNDEETGAEL